MQCTAAMIVAVHARFNTQPSFDLVNQSHIAVRFTTTLCVVVAVTITLYNGKNVLISFSYDIIVSAVTPVYRRRYVKVAQETEYPEQFKGMRVYLAMHCMVYMG